MTRIALGLIALMGIAASAQPALAQSAAKKAKTPAPASSAASAAPAEAAPVEAAAAADAAAAAPADVKIDDPLSDPLLNNGADKNENPLKAPGTPGTPDQPAVVGKTARYQDIVVVPRKDFLKTGRLELAPSVGITVNDPLIRHYGFGGELTYFLTDVFGVGLQGMYFVKEQTDRDGLVGLQYNRTASLNRYIWQAALDFTYVPVYGKFALFNKSIIHWEGYASGGIGMVKSEIIPRQPSGPLSTKFSTNAIAPNFGVGGRLYLLDWLTVNVAIRDYVFNDKFEPTNRDASQTIAQVKSNATSQFVNNIMIYAGVGFYLPPSFNYRSPR